MKKIFALLLVPCAFDAMELPMALSPRSQESARQTAVVNVNRAEQHAFQDEATKWVAALEQDLDELQEEVKELQAKAPQINAAMLRAIQIASIHDQEIDTLNRIQLLQSQSLTQKLDALQKMQQEQAQLQAQREAELQRRDEEALRRIAAAEKSNYYLKWALGITTVVTTTAFSLMGYLLWKNQEANKIIVQEDYKGRIIGFSQGRGDVPYIALPQSTPFATAQPAAVVAKPAQQTPAPVVTPAQPSNQPQVDSSKYVTPEYLKTYVATYVDERLEELPKISRIIGQDNKSIYLKYDDGTPSYSPQFWPNNGQP